MCETGAKDGCAAYNTLVRKGSYDGPRLAGCWAHSRRRFYKLHAAGDSGVATTTVERMADLWGPEADIGGKTPEARAAARQAVLTPIAAELISPWQKILPRISGTSKPAEVLRYTNTRRDIFERFLTDGLIELDSIIPSRQIASQSPACNGTNAPSGHKPSPGKTACSRDMMAVAGHGPASQRFCKPAR